MTEGKMRKTITAIAAATTLLLVILLSVLIYQWISIGVQNKRIEALEERNAYWQQQNAQLQEDLEEYEGQDYIYWAMAEAGYRPNPSVK